MKNGDRVMRRIKNKFKFRMKKAVKKSIGKKGRLAGGETVGIKSGKWNVSEWEYGLVLSHEKGTKKNYYIQ